MDETGTMADSGGRVGPPSPQPRWASATKMKNPVPWQAAAITAGLLLAGPLYQVALFAVVLYFLHGMIRKREFRFSGEETVILLYVASGAHAFRYSGADLPVMGRVMLHHLVLLAWIPLARSIDSLGAESRRALALWLRGTVLLGGVVGLVAVTRFLATEQERASGLYGGFYFLSGQMVWVLPLGLSVVMTGSRRLATAAGLASVLAFGALCFSYTRSAFLGWFLAGGVWLPALGRDWFRGAPGQRPRLLRRLVLVAILPFMLLVFLLNTSDSRISSMVPSPARTEEPTVTHSDLSSGRGSIIGDGLDILRGLQADGDYRAILFGTGLDSRKRLVGGVFTSWESDYLQTLLNQGAAGLALLVLIWWRIMRSALRGVLSGRPEGVALAASMTALFLMSPLTLVVTGWQMAGLLVLGESWLRLFRSPSRG